MSDSNRVDVASAELHTAYTVDGRSSKFLDAKEYDLGYQAELQVLVVRRRGSPNIHSIPWANVAGMMLQRRAPAVVSEPPKEPGGSESSRPAPGGNPRRNRPAQ